jgi:hypothetical protein
VTCSDEPKREAEGQGEERQEQPDGDAQGSQPESGATDTTGAGETAAEGAAEKDQP